jgi:uncharacterized protein (TIGR03089 family)
VTTPSTPAGLLAAALSADPSRPLLTYYDDATSERTELSVATFGNWVAKTANLLRDDLDLQPGARVEVDLPLHWQAAVWLQACWAMGLVVVLPSGPAPAFQPVELAVVTHDRAQSSAAEVVSLGLGPMGLARPGALPAYAGALDYDREVHGHGDVFSPTVPPLEEDAALVLPPRGEGRDGGAALTGGELAVAAASAEPLPAGGRLLVTTAFTTPAAVVGGLLVPLLDDAAAQSGTVPHWGSLPRE